MSAEAITWILYVLVPLFAVGALILTYNLATVPYRLQKERADGAEARLAEIERDALLAAGEEVPWFLREIITFRQCQVFAVGSANIQVLFPWRLRCTPSLSWGKAEESDFTPHDIQISAWDDQSITLKLSRDYLRKRPIDEALRMLKELNPVINADSGEGLATAARRFGFGSTNESATQAHQFIVDALSDPKKSYPYLIRALSS